MWCAPADRDEVLKVAVVTPSLVDRVPVPRTVEPSAKLTGPLGGATAVSPGNTTLTVAVKVTGWPNSVAFTDEASASVVAACRTGQTTGGPDVLAAMVEMIRTAVFLAGEGPAVDLDLIEKAGEGGDEVRRRLGAGHQGAGAGKVGHAG